MINNFLCYYWKLGAKLRELISFKKVEGGVIVPYCKTRWTTAYKSIADVIRLKPVLEEVCKKYKILFVIIII